MAASGRAVRAQEPGAAMRRAAVTLAQAAPRATAWSPSVVVAQPELGLARRDRERERLALDLHVVLMELAAVASLAQAPGPDRRALPLIRLVDRDQAAVAARQDQVAVRLIEATLRLPVDGVVEANHLDEIVARPGLGPAVFVRRVGSSAFVVIRVDQRHAAIPAQDVGVGQV